MIHAVELENFKGVGARTRLEFAPVTLLFGANNAGKSTVVQALLYVLEALEHGAADVGTCRVGGDAVDLGGFDRVVHAHDPRGTVSIRVEFSTAASLNCFDRELTAFPFPDLDDQVEDAWLELRAGRFASDEDDARSVNEAAVIKEVLIGVGGDATPLLRLHLDPKRFMVSAEPVRVSVNFSHALLANPRDGEGVRDGLGHLAVALDEQHLTFAISGSIRPSAVPSLQDPIRLIPYDGLTEEPEWEPVYVATVLIEMLALGTIRQLVRALGGGLYVGPLRRVPSRASLLEGRGEARGWADGLAAWEALLRDRSSLVDRTNTWLTRLGAGCRIVVQRLQDPSADAEALSVDYGGAVVRRLLLNVGSAADVLPSEVGAGISQLVPVVVATLQTKKGGLVLVEQPEIHVHPALQVELGDLFIESSTERQLIIETHSEHIILRLLRRIRETHDGDLPDGAPSFQPEKLSVLYVEQTAEGSAARRLHIDPSGEFLERWPKGFFEERTEELF